MANYVTALLSTAAAYKAKLLCSGVFVSGRSPTSLLKEDLAADTLLPLKGFQSEIDYDRRTVTVSFLGITKRTALYRPGLGSTLLFEKNAIALHQQSQPFTIWQQSHPTKPTDLPTGRPPNPKQLEQSLDAAFSEPNASSLLSKRQRTRAVVILHMGKLIAERYAPGFCAHTPMLGWSLCKSVINALIGILVKDGKLSLQQDHLFPEWQSPTDPRRHITLDHLLRMSSGLKFSETYANPLSDAITMLFQRGNKSAYAAALPLESKPGIQFSYASGSTVLLCRLIRDTLGGSLTDYLAFPLRALFHKLGITTATLEPDETGIFTGSSFMYATARDWAKLGQLYLQDGCWNGERLLPTGWVTCSTKESSITPFYGAHFWRGVPNSFAGEPDREGWPADAYLASGYQGQFVTVVPSQQLVVVRLGLSQRRNSWNHVAFIRSIVRAMQSN